MTKARWIIFALVCIATIGGLVLVSRGNKIDVSQVDVNAIIASGENADRVYGDKNSKVIVIEYADFQCPGCASFDKVTTSVRKKYQDHIAFVYRHYPLSTIHPNAFASAASAEAANKQGKFWEMSEQLFLSQSEWERASASERDKIFQGYASSLGLNIEQFRADVASKQTANAINYDRALGAKAGVSATPTMFLNGQKINNDIINQAAQGDAKAFTDKLDQAIRETGGTPPSN